MLRFRKVIRWFHIFGGLYMGTFLFSPLIEVPAALLAAQIVSLGLLMTGLGMWQWGRVTGTLRRMGAL